MPPLAMVKDLEVLEQSGGQFDPRVPAFEGSTCKHRPGETYICDQSPVRGVHFFDRYLEESSTDSGFVDQNPAPSLYPVADIGQVGPGRGTLRRQADHRRIRRLWVNIRNHH